MIGPTGDRPMKQTEASELMDLAQTLENVAVGLRSGELDNEAQVKQSVILPILRALDWDDSDYKSFKPEYSAGHGRVDYALLDRRRGEPLVFIEAKQIGALDAAGEEQLFGYASNKGVPLLVLTDGDRWDFYLSMAEGVPSERRFYRMELKLENKIPEYVDSLVKYLHKDRVVSGQAKLDAKGRHANNWWREGARRAIPDAWQSLLKEPDEMLRDLLAERVESECGTKPKLDDVDEFLKGVSPIIPELKLKFNSFGGLVGFVLRGERVITWTAIGTLIALVKRLAREYPAFMERFASKTRGRSRKLVARNRKDLYPPESSHLIDASEKLEKGWWLGKNRKQEEILKHIKTACEVAGVRFVSE